jgi:hypothetical protein
MLRNISYHQVKDSLKTGDLLLFHGLGQVSHLIELLEWSYWSHVGMVVLPKDVGLEGDEPLFFESTSSGDGIIDVISGVSQESGVMLVPLSERISVDLEKDFDNHFKVKYLSRGLTTEELVTLKVFVLSVHGNKFPSDEDLLKYYFEGRLRNVPMPGNEMFCSQLVAQTFMSLGFISPDYVANGYSPQDFNAFEAIPSTKAFLLYDGAQLK